MPAPSPSPSRFRRWFLLAFGMLFVGIAFLGVLLPLIPATPFLLLASYFFVRSSPRLNDRMRKSKLFGGLIRDWQEKRGVRRSVKVTAVVMIPVAVAASAYFGQLSWPLLAALVALGLVGLIYVIRLPVVRDDDE